MEFEDQAPTQTYTTPVMHALFGNNLQSPPHSVISLNEFTANWARCRPHFVEIRGHVPDYLTLTAYRFNTPECDEFMTCKVSTYGQAEHHSLTHCLFTHDVPVVILTPTNSMFDEHNKSTDEL